MKSQLRISFLLISLVFFNKYTKAQSTSIIDIPGAIGYTAYALNVNGDIIPNQNISLRMTILHGSETGTVDWVERQQVTTTYDSYFKIMVGTGQRTGGSYTTFAELDWSGSHFLKVEMDITGGNNFSFSTTEEFSSVPFAFHAAVADSLSGINIDSLKLAIISALNPVNPNEVPYANNSGYANYASYAYNSGVADSLAGVKTDSLKRAISTVLNAINFNLAGGCNCTLQGAYDNGTTIQNGLNGTTGPVLIDNNLWSGQSLHVKSTSSLGYPALFENLNPTSNQNAVQIQNNGVNYGLFVNNFTAIANNTKHHTILAQNLSLSGSGLVSQLFNSNNNYPSISSYTRGTSYAGYFTTSNQFSINSAIRSEIPLTSQTLHGGVGEYYIFKTNNDADALRVQTDGTGRCLSVLHTNATTLIPAVDIQNNSNSPALQVLQTGSIGSAGVFNNSGNGNPTIVVTKFNANGSAAIFNKQGLTGIGAAVIINSNSSDGDGEYVISNSTQTTGLPITFQSLTRGTGVAGYFRNSIQVANNFPLLLTEQNSLGIGMWLRGQNTLNSKSLFLVENLGNGRSAFVNGLNASTILPVTEITGISTGNLLNVNLGGNSNVFNPLVAFNNNTTQSRAVVSIENQASSWGLVVRNTSQANSSNIAFTAANFSTSSISEGARIQNNYGVGLRVRATGNDALYVESGSNGSSSFNAITATKNANDPGYAGEFLGPVRGSSFIVFSGSKSTVIKDNSGSQKLLYCEESPEVWFTDYGIGQLVLGHAVVLLDPTFINASVTTQTYHVFVQLEDDCGNGVKVINKGINSFEVVQMGLQATCNASFSYRISAKRKYFDNLRFASEAVTKTANLNMINAVWPETNARITEIHNQGNITGQGLSALPAQSSQAEQSPLEYYPQEISIPSVPLPALIQPASPSNIQFDEEGPH